MNFKFTTPQSLFEMVKKDFKGSVEDKAMTASGMAMPPIHDLGKNAGKRKRMREIGQKILRTEFNKVREQIRKTDMSSQEKRNTAKQAQIEVQKISKQFGTLLGFKK